MEGQLNSSGDEGWKGKNCPQKVFLNTMKEFERKTTA